MLDSPRLLKAALDAAAKLVWEAGQGVYVGSCAQQLPLAPSTELPAALLRRRVGAAPRNQHRQEDGSCRAWMLGCSSRVLYWRFGCA